MKAIAKICVNEDETSFVNAYASRPVLTLKKKDSSLRPLVLTFADAIARFGNALKDDHLREAYRRAGNSFGGLLQQNFVVLKEGPAPVASRGTLVGAMNRTPAKKRLNELMNEKKDDRVSKITKM